LAHAIRVLTAERRWTPLRLSERNLSDACRGEIGKKGKETKVVEGSRIVPVHVAGTKRSAGRRTRSKQMIRPPAREMPEDEVATQEISEIFNIDDEDADDIDLIEHILRRGPIRGRRL
jgi:hypothetical protein